MKRLLAGAVLIVLVALYFNNDFLRDAPHVSYDSSGFIEDHRNVLAGMSRIHCFSDTLQWWHGCGIDPAHPFLRPVTAYLLYAQTWVAIHYGFGYAAWSAFFLFTLCCLICAQLTYTLTRSHALSLLTGLFAATVGWHLPGVATPTGSLPFRWWYISDNTLAIAFSLLTLIAFLKWREFNQRKDLGLCWLGLITSCYSKELAYVLFAMCGALTLLPATVSRRRALRQVLLMGCFTIALYVFRQSVLVYPHDSPNRALATELALRSAWERYAPPTSYEVFLMDWRGAVGAFCYYGLLFLIWRYRRVLRRFAAQETLYVPILQCLALWACVQLAYLPVMGFLISGHSGLFAGFLRCVFWTLEAQLVLRLLAAIINPQHPIGSVAVAPGRARGATTS
jgi:hypothetical protein